MSSPIQQTWEDRRALFQRGKEVHEPARRPSQGAATGITDAVRRSSVGSAVGSTIEKTLSGASASSGTAAGAGTGTGQRRRSSQSGTLFGNLQQHKRGSEDYENRRAAHADQHQTGGLMSGWFNSTFRGMKGGEGQEK